MNWLDHSRHHPSREVLQNLDHRQDLHLRQNDAGIHRHLQDQGRQDRREDQEVWLHPLGAQEQEHLGAAPYSRHHQMEQQQGLAQERSQHPELTMKRKPM